MIQKSYFEKIKELIEKKEGSIGRKLTIEEQDEIKSQAMNQLWIETSKKIKEEEEL